MTLTGLTGLAVLAAGALAAPGAGLGQSGASLCADNERGIISCGPGNDRQSAGGGTKVPHDNGLTAKNGERPTRVWPRLSGILWIVLDDSRTPYRKIGGPLNDELNGHHGSDTLSGGTGHDIIWGDWDPDANNGAQRDVLSGGAGNDWIYPSHGKTIVKGGPGSDYIWAFYGRGTIDCGPGIDIARIRTNGFFKTRNCERIKHFCQFGQNKQGQCLSPTGKPAAAASLRYAR
jgi:Ca2+-binding RTX toxin-like protein